MYAILFYVHKLVHKDNARYSRVTDNTHGKCLEWGSMGNLTRNHKDIKLLLGNELRNININRLIDSLYGSMRDRHLHKCVHLSGKNTILLGILLLNFIKVHIVI